MSGRADEAAADVGLSVERGAEDLLCDIAVAVAAIKTLASHFHWEGSQIDLRGPIYRSALRREVDIVLASQIAVEALADRASRELDDLDEAIRRERQEPCP